MKKNVAILISQLAGGGAERVASNLSLNLSEDMLNKYVIVYDDKRVDYPYKGKLINMKISASSNPIGKILNLIRRIYKLRFIKKEYSIEATISLLSSPNIINILSRKNDMVIVSVRNYISKSSKGFYGTLFKVSIRVLYNKADLIVAVSNAIKDDLVKNFGLNESKIKVIYNPYDIEKIYGLAQEKIQDEYIHIFDKPTIITVGRLSKQKAQWSLIRAFKKIKEEIPEANLIILGQGELEDYLKQLALDLGLEKSVYFLGFQNNPFKFIAKSTVYAFTSLYEGFPNALCEAMACSVPVISTDCKSGPREILAPNTDVDISSTNIEHNEYGILVPVCDDKMYNYTDELTETENLLSKSILEILENKDLQEKYSKLAFSRVRDFSKENIINNWESVIFNWREKA